MGKQLQYPTLLTIICIIDKPRFSTKDRHIVANIGESVQLHCSPDGYPTPTIYWSRNDAQIVEGNILDIALSTYVYVALHTMIVINIIAPCILKKC